MQGLQDSVHLTLQLKLPRLWETYRDEDEEEPRFTGEKQPARAVRKFGVAYTLQEPLVSSSPTLKPRI